MKTITIQISAPEASALTTVLSARDAGDCYPSKADELMLAVNARVLRAYITQTPSPRARKRAVAGTLVP